MLLASINAGYFIRRANRERTTARRVGASALALMNSGLALEAGLFLFLTLQAAGVFGAFDTARLAVFVRSILLASVALVSLLIWRGRLRRD